MLGDGDQVLAQALQRAADLRPDRVAFRRGYDEGLSHLLFAGGDLLAMPSRFEPCGLAQMQAMRYGTLPVVTDVGGLARHVVDIDDHPDDGHRAWSPGRAPGGRCSTRCTGACSALGVPDAPAGHAAPRHDGRLVLGWPGPPAHRPLSKAARSEAEREDRRDATGRSRAEGARDRPGRR